MYFWQELVVLTFKGNYTISSDCLLHTYIFFFLYAFIINHSMMYLFWVRCYGKLYILLTCMCIVYLWTIPDIFLQEFMTLFLLLSTKNKSTQLFTGFCRRYSKMWCYIWNNKFRWESSTDMSACYPTKILDLHFQASFYPRQNSKVVGYYGASSVQPTLSKAISIITMKCKQKSNLLWCNHPQ